MIVAVVLTLCLILSHYCVPGELCTERQRLFQHDNFELAGIHICDTDTVWKLAQLAMPDASVFFDIGGNLGYTAALMFGLWSPGHGFSRHSLRRVMPKAIRMNLTSNHNQVTTFCKDGRVQDVPMACVGQPAESTFCQFRRSVTVYSFDGQLSHVSNQRSVIYKFFPQLHPNHSYAEGVTQVKSRWEYVHAAVTDKQSAAKGTGYFLINNNELGSLLLEKPADLQAYLPVQLLTVDVFAEQRALTRIDVLKIDTEGNDIRVIHGADITLRSRGVRMVTFECTNCLDGRWGDLFQQMDLLGFDCFLNGINNLLVKMTNCWDYSRPLVRPNCHPGNKCPIYMRFAGRKFAQRALDGNAYCAHRQRASALLQLLDNMSLYRFAPAADEQKLESHPQGHFHKDSLLSLSNVKHHHSNGSWSIDDNQRSWYESMYGRDAANGNKTFWTRFS